MDDDMAIKDKDFIKIIRKLGFNKVRNGKGSHQIWTDGKSKITINRGHDINRMIARRLLKDAGYSEYKNI